MHHAAIRSGVGLLALVLLAARPAVAQSSDDLFDVETLQEIRLSLNSADVQRLQSSYLENTYYTADLQWRNLRVRNIGVRSRGTASRSSTKPAFQIEFDRYVSSQQFLGLRSLVLDNLWQDSAMIRERLAMALFARMGQPSSRESFARVYVNDVYYGVYAIVEDVTQEFLLRTTGEGGYLFEYKYQGPYHFEYLGDDLAAYKPLFEPRSRQREADAMLYAPIRDLIREINEPDDAVWRERVEALLDLRQFVAFVAIQTFLAEPDGILGVSGIANFYLARSGPDTPHRLIAWDMDRALSEIGFPIFQRADENLLFQRAIAFPDLRAHYLDTLESCARSALTGGWLYSQVVRSAAIITSAVEEDVRKPQSNEAFAEAVEFIKRFARFRPLVVLAEVARARR